jgi:hypothetical protein
MYPLLVRPLARLLGDQWTLAAILVANLALVGGLIGFFLLVLKEFGDRSLAKRALVYMVFFPTGVFLVAPYPESLLLLCSVSSIWLASSDHWGWAVLPLAAAGLTRPQGVVLVLPMAMLAFRVWKAHHALFPWAVSVAPVAGLGAFLAWRSLSGFPPINQVAEIYWHRVPAWPISGMWLTFLRLWSGQASMIEAVEFGLLAVMLALGVYLIWRLPHAFSLYYWAGLLLSLSTLTAQQPLASQARYVVTLFPAFIALGMLGRRPWVHRLILYPTFGLYLFMAGQYLMWGWVG